MRTAKKRQSRNESPGGYLEVALPNDAQVRQTLEPLDLRLPQMWCTWQSPQHPLLLLFARTIMPRGVRAFPGVGKQVVLFRFLIPNERYYRVDV